MKRVKVKAKMFLRILILVLFVSVFCCPLFAATDVTGSDDSRSLLSLFVIDGGPIVWYVLIPISILMMFVTCVLCLTIRRGNLLPDGIAEEISTAAKGAKAGELAEKLAGREDIASKVIARVIVKSRHLDADKKHMHDLASEALHEQALFLLRKVEWCGIIGNVAPMVGLFGTVYGMIQAFDVLGVAGGQPRPDQLAAKISIALVTTFWGLLIAIPSLVIAGVFRSRVESIVAEAGVEIELLIGKLFRGRAQQADK
jgi:biopolymer transport protein ExbB